MRCKYIVLYAYKQSKSKYMWRYSRGMSRGDWRKQDFERRRGYRWLFDTSGMRERGNISSRKFLCTFHSMINELFVFSFSGFSVRVPTCVPVFSLARSMYTITVLKSDRDRSGKSRTKRARSEGRVRPCFPVPKLLIIICFPNEPNRSYVTFCEYFYQGIMWRPRRRASRVVRLGVQRVRRTTRRREWERLNKKQH